jgi:tetratricopeptide (TPR) repeat protein
MAPSPDDPMLRLQKLLSELNEREVVTVWLFDDGPERLALDRALASAGVRLRKRPHPSGLQWQRGRNNLIYIHQSQHDTTGQYPAPDRVLWLTPPLLDLPHFWQVLTRRLADRPVPAAAAHWARLQQAAPLAPAGPELTLHLGCAALAVGRDEEARTFARQLGDAGAVDWHTQAQVRLQAPLAWLSGDKEAATSLWRTVLQAETAPDLLRAAAAAGLAQLYGDRPEARACWQDAARLAPAWSQPHLALSQLAAERGRLDEALAALQTAQGLAPGSRLVLSALGRLQSRLNNHGEAARLLSQAVARPANPTEMGRDYLLLGRALVADGRVSEGVAALAQAAAFTPGRSAPHNALGNVLAQRGDYAAAITHYERAILCGDLALPNLAKIHNGLANAQYQVGDHAAAIRNYEQAIALDYKYARAYNGLGMVLRATGRYEAATEAFQKAISLENGYAAPYYGLGSIYSVTGRLAEAAQAYKASIAREPDSALPYCSLAAIYQRQGREDEAAIQLNEAAKLIDREKAYNVACYAAIKGDDAAALEWLDRAIRETPGIRSWIRRDPDFASLQALPRFQELTAPP